MASVAAALIALLGIIIAGFLSTIVAEDYRRFRDGTGLAAALAGELASYMLATEIMLPIVDGLQRATIATGGVSLLPQEMHMQPDPVFDAGVGNLGLLGTELAEDTAFVYQQLRAFRGTYKLLSAPNLQLGQTQTLAILAGWKGTLERAQGRGKPLVVSLKSRANQPYVAPWPLNWLQRLHRAANRQGEAD